MLLMKKVLLQLCMLPICAICLILSNCKSEEAKTVEPEQEEVFVPEWEEGTLSVKEYREQYPDRDMLIFFNADWGVTGAAQFERMKEDKRGIGVLGKKDVLFIKYDCTDPEGLGMREFKTYGVGVFPCFALYKRNGAVDKYLFDVVGDELNELLIKMGKDIEQQSDAPAVSWERGILSVKDYHKLSPDKHIFIFFNANWGHSGHVLMKRLESEYKGMGIMGKKDVRFIVYDCTDRSELGGREFEALGGKIILSFFLVKKNGDIKEYGVDMSEGEMEKLLTKIGQDAEEN